MRRRRCLRVLAADAGLALLPATGSETAGLPPRLRWRGAALGAEARIDLWLDDPARAGRLVGSCLAEIDRLERIFSLQRRDSALATLNREGRLHRPSWSSSSRPRTASPGSLGAPSTSQSCRSGASTPTTSRGPGPTLPALPHARSSVRPG